MKYLSFLLLLISLTTIAQSLRWQNIPPRTDASFRGLSVVDDSIAWVSGSKGWVGRSLTAGRTWAFVQVKGYEKCDFRSLYALDSVRAVIANAGSPAFVLRTEDGGKTWTKVYEDRDTTAFFDGIDFPNTKHGIIYGDPKGGVMEVLRSDNFGKTWRQLPNRPQLAEGEASFAASGTTIRWVPGGRIMIATGGKVSRLWISRNGGKGWLPVSTPIIQGKSTTGIFSVVWNGKRKMIIVGGDYRDDTLKKDHVFYTRNGGRRWKAPTRPTRGYRECVNFVDESTLVAIGPTGTDISFDGGKNWYPENDEKQFHVIKKADQGNLVIAAGGGGRIAIVKPIPGHTD